MANLPDELMVAADNVDELSRSEIQVLLRKSALMIRDLRLLVTIRDEIVAEGMPPEEGNVVHLHKHD